MVPRTAVIAQRRKRSRIYVTLTATVTGVPESCLKSRPRPVSKFEAKHQLNLSRQPGSGVGRGSVVIIIVEIHGRIDKTEAALWLQDPTVRYRVPRVVGGLSVVEGQVVAIGIAVLSVIEDIEYLRTKLHGHALGQLCLLG